MTTKTLQVGPLSIRASLKPDTVNEEKRTVDVTFSMGAKVMRSTWQDGQFLEELVMSPEACRLDRLNNGAPFLNTHDGGDALRVYGVVEPGTAKITNGAGVCTVRFDTAENDPDADKLFRKIKAGIVANVSVGYRSHTIEKIVKEGEKLPTYRVTSWTPFEVSAVPMGADDGAGFRSSDAATTNEVTITTRGEFPVNEKEGQRMTPEEIKAMQEKAAADAKRSAEAEIETRVAAQLKLSRERDAGIQHACRTAKLDQSFADKLVASTSTLDQARALVIDELAKRSDAVPTENHVRVTGVEGQDEREKFMRGVGGAMMSKLGNNGAVQIAKRRGLEGFKDLDVDGGHFRGMRLADIARVCAERSGQSTKNIYDPERLFALALNQRAGGSTGDFAVLFENVMYKSMRAAYGIQADTWRRWCGTDTVQDFKASNRYMGGAFGETLPVVPENAEFKQINIPDGSKLAITTETRGGIIGLSRQAMINDDMGALVSIATEFGKLAGDSIESAAYAKLLENGGLGPTVGAAPFFDNAVNGNVNTSSVLGIAGLDSDKQKMRSHVRGNGFIDQMPSILLVPVGLEGQAKVLNESAYDHSGALDQKPNIVRGMFNDIVSTPRLTGTRRYLFTQAKEAFKVVFLEGSGEGPVMTSEEGFSIDSTKWKCRIDFKVNPFDPKTALTSAGT